MKVQTRNFNLRFIDCFAGAGGMSQGLEAAGFELMFAFDLEPLAIQTLRQNHPGREHLFAVADICDLIDPSALSNFGITAGEVDLVVGGPPCQGFSVQRTTGADEDDRNELVLKFMEFVNLVKPRLFLMENVPALAGVRGKRILQKAVAYIERNGYLTTSSVLEASRFGVPQRRRRRFILGERTDSPFMSVSLPEKSDCPVQTVRHAISHFPPPPENGRDHPDYIHHRRDMISDKNLQRLRSLKGGEGRKNLPRQLLADCHLRSADEIGHRNVYGRMEWDSISPTITARFDSFTRGQFGHPDQDRTISLREGACLQTFPESYTFAGNKVEIARQIGNAVPPRLAEAIGNHLKSQMGND